MSIVYDCYVMSPQELTVSETHKTMIVQPSPPERASPEKVVQFDVEKGVVKVSDKRRGNWFNRKRSKTDEDEEPLIEVGTKDLLKLNIPDWFLVIPGIVASAIMGVLFPTIAILFSGVLDVSGTSNRSLTLYQCSSLVRLTEKH